MAKFEFTEGLTHAGIFHADDVFSTAFLKLLNPDIRIQRVFKVPADVPISTIVYDIGMGEFDHHQEDGDMRECGVKYAAFGLLWREFGTLLGLTDEEVANFDEKFVKHMDATDNNGQVAFPNPMSAAISMLNPIAGSEESADDQFICAVELATSILKREIEVVKTNRKFAEEVSELAKPVTNHVLVLPEFKPMFVLSKEENEHIWFVVYPSNRGGFNLQTVKDGTGVTRKEFTPNLKVGYCGANFVHAGRFIAAFDREEDAIKVALESAEI